MYVIIQKSKRFKNYNDRNSKKKYYAMATNYLKL